MVHLGYFATAEEAALCVARTPEGKAAAKRAAAAPPLTSEEALQQAQAEELALVVADSKAGYFGVRLNKPGQPKPYRAQVSRGGKMVSLGNFATAEEAALCVARSPEGRAAAERSTALTGEGGGGEEADEAAIEVDAIEVNAWSDDDDEALVVEAEEGTLVAEADASACACASASASASAFG